MALDPALRAWIDEHRSAHRFSVRKTPLKELDGWSFNSPDGDLVHRSGGFFSIHGVEVSLDDGREPWTQPIIRQAEIGILGILATEFDGAPHVLLQAKPEPGNIGPLQLSPTVQATRSNYTRLHRGAAVPYLEYFLDPGRAEVVTDTLQSEQGSWFWGKRNRNSVVVTRDEVPVREGFRWFSLPELDAALRVDNLVNMDTRSALSGLADAPWDSDASALHPTTHILARLTAAKASRRLSRRRIPLREVRDWHIGNDRIHREDGRFFSIIGVDVEAGKREVSRWSQPLLAPSSQGVVAFVLRRFTGEPHVLMHLRTDAGTFDVTELAPTVMCSPDNYPEPVPDGRLRHLDEVLGAPPERRLVDVVHSEEGGRFHHARNRYTVVEVEDGYADQPGDDHVWVSLRQLAGLARYGNVVDVGARCLLTCLTLSGHHPVTWRSR
ncbi:NDP-hexose 2,3-dehydratase family protein [Nocardiopsis halotolerans]|uniref:NDP-hexose 2,3-dehydratase family protein n=1 Tax=Nocardiopsis halotolerans TaxID=124252 RepID=UPI00034795C3|nr:NDP-hexose 2,3-dehydratase family protein [Nocardiopsis halotolerans]